MYEIETRGREAVELMTVTGDIFDHDSVEQDGGSHQMIHPKGKGEGKWNLLER